MSGPRFANVVSLLALFVALSGSAYAAVKIRGKDVVNSSLTGADVRNGSIRSADVAGLRRVDFAKGQLPAATAGPAGPIGPVGPVGPAGAQGLQGPAGANAIDTPLPGARIANGIDALTVPMGVDNEFDMNKEVFDTGDMATAGGDAITIQRAGTYLVQGLLTVSGGGSPRQLRIVIGGSPVEYVVDRTGSPLQTLQVSTVRRLQPGDQLRLGTFTSAAAETAEFAGADSAWLAVQFLGA